MIFWFLRKTKKVVLACSWLCEWPVAAPWYRSPSLRAHFTTNPFDRVRCSRGWKLSVLCSTYFKLMSHSWKCWGRIILLLCVVWLWYNMKTISQKCISLHLLKCLCVSFPDFASLSFFLSDDSRSYGECHPAFTDFSGRCDRGHNHHHASGRFFWVKHFLGAVTSPRCLYFHSLPLLLSVFLGSQALFSWQHKLLTSFSLCMLLPPSLCSCFHHLSSCWDRTGLWTPLGASG